MWCWASGCGGAPGRLQRLVTRHYHGISRPSSQLINMPVRSIVAFMTSCSTRHAPTAGSTAPSFSQIAAYLEAASRLSIVVNATHRKEQSNTEQHRSDMSDAPCQCDAQEGAESTEQHRSDMSDAPCHMHTLLQGQDDTQTTSGFFQKDGKGGDPGQAVRPPTTTIVNTLDVR